MSDTYRADKAHLYVDRGAVPVWFTPRLRRSCGSGLFDHYGTDAQGRLVTEPYGDPYEIASYASEFAARCGLAYSTSPVAWHSPRATRVTFWPKEKTMPMDPTTVQQFSRATVPPGRLPEAADGVEAVASLAKRGVRRAAELMSPQAADPTLSYLEGALPTQYSQAESLKRNKRYWDVGPAMEGEE